MTVPIVHDLDPTVRARIDHDMPALPPTLNAAVEEIWQAASARMARGSAGRLFNGRVFSADHITPTLITGHFTEFRRVVAQYEQPGLHDELQLRPLAVSGLLCCTDGVMIGRRHVDAVYEAGLWQLPPAGSVDPSALGEDGWIDLRHQFHLELQEELGLSLDRMNPPRPLCMSEHPTTHVSDVGLLLRLDLPGSVVLTAHREAGNGEYAPLRLVPYADLAGFVTQFGDLMVPSAAVFLERAGLIPSSGA